MKPRPIIELLKILDRELDFVNIKGLCALIRYLYCWNYYTLDEATKVDMYIKRHKPFGKTNNMFWWPKGLKEPRHKFIQKLIKREERWNRLLQVLKFWSSWGH
jgi:hypothetical protein